MKIDLHVHSVYSDGDSLKKIIAFAKLRGLSGLAICDHGTIKGAIEASKITRDLLIVPGAEVSTDTGHVLVLGVQESPPREKMEYFELIDWVKERDGITVLAHPATLLKLNQKLLEKKVDAVEVYNSLYPIFWLGIKISNAVAEKLQVSKVGGSDAHRAENVGLCYTTLPPCNNADELIEAIKRKQTKPYGTPSPILTRLHTTAHFLKTMLLNHTEI